MRLITPPLRVEPDDAFKNDALERKSFGEALFNIVVQSRDPLVISLDGNWGEGKTTFVKMWQGLLRENHIHNIYIDAFANDYVDDAFISIASAITAYAEEHITQDDQEKLIELTKKVGVQLLSWGTKIGIKAATMGAIDHAEILEGLKDVEKDISTDFSKYAGNLVEKRLKSHTKDIELVQSFREFLSSLPKKLQAEESQQENGDTKPLVIIIDELDRCKPTFAVEIVEKVKHLFSVEHVVFVLVMNKIQLEESIKNVYGQNIDAHTYLQKFVNLEAKLPKYTGELYPNDFSKYIDKLLQLHQIETWGEDRQIHPHLESLAKHFNLSLRQLEKIFTNLAISYAANKQNHYRNIPIIVFLSVIRVVDPQIFNALLNQEISYDETCEKLNFSDDSNYEELSTYHQNLSLVMQQVRHYLFTKQELKKLERDGKLQELGKSLYHNLRREEVIPFFGQKMSLFDFNQL